MKGIMGKGVALIYLVLFSFSVVHATGSHVGIYIQNETNEPPKGSTVYESLKFHSEILKRDVSYSVYLPKDYEGSTMTCLMPELRGM